MITTARMIKTSQESLQQSCKALKDEISIDPFYNMTYQLKMLSTIGTHIVRMIANIGCALYCIPATLHEARTSTEGQKSDVLKHGALSIGHFLIAAIADYMNIIMTIATWIGRTFSSIVYSYKEHSMNQAGSSAGITNVAEAVDKAVPVPAAASESSAAVALVEAAAITPKEEAQRQYESTSALNFNF